MQHTKEDLVHMYQIVIDPLNEEDGGGFVATVPDLPGCMADGETVAEAAAEARDAMLSYLEALEEEGKDFPAPLKRYTEEDVSGHFQVRIPKSLHARLKLMAQEEGVSLNSLVSVLFAEGAAKRAA